MNKYTKIVDIFELLIASILVVDLLANLMVFCIGVRDFNFVIVQILQCYWSGLLCAVVTLFIIIFLFKKVRLAIPILLGLDMAFALTGPDLIYLYHSSSYLSAIFLNKLSVYFGFIEIILAIIASYFWFCELWQQRKDRGFYSLENKFGYWCTKLVPFWLALVWLVLLTGFICALWSMPYLYFLSQKSWVFTGMIYILSVYFIAVLFLSWLIMYRLALAMALYLVIAGILLEIAMLNIHMIFWFAFRWWELVILASLSFSIISAYLLSGGILWCWVLERRMARNLKQQKRSPLWSRILVVGLVTFAVIRLFWLMQAQYANDAPMKLDVVYYLNPNGHDARK